MRLAVYSDFSYRRAAPDPGAADRPGTGLTAELPFVIFMAALGAHFERLVLVGRLDPGPAPFPYAVGPGIDFAPLPYYSSLSRPGSALVTVWSTLARFWRVLDDVDVVWLLGPHPFALAFAVLAAFRGRRVALGIRQDFPRYTRYRHPDRRSLQLAALALQAAFRWMARRTDVVVVGPDLARQFRSARRLLDAWISLVPDRDVVGDEVVESRRYDGELRVLSVGRLEAEKNPLLLADVLALLHERDPRWRLVVCGDGPMAGDLAARLEERGVRAAADLRGYVPVDGPLPELYRSSHAFLHVSWTEGMPQVLIEAFAAGLPMVATAVGGVPEVADGCAVLVGPGDAGAAAQGLLALAQDPELRARLVAGGLARAREHTLEAECARVARFLRGEDP